MTEKSKIEQTVLKPDFCCGDQFTGGNIFTLRCVVESKTELFRALFERGVDAGFYHLFLYDRAGELASEGDRAHVLQEEDERFRQFCAWANYPHVLISDVAKGDGERLLRVDRLICYFNGIARESLPNFERSIGCGENRLHLISFRNECVFSVYDDRCEVIFATKEKYCEFFARFKPYCLSGDMRIMQRVNDENMFLDSQTRKRLGGSGYFEFQFCKKHGSVRKLAQGKPYQAWLEDSLYVYMDYDTILFREYGQYLNEPTTPNGEHAFDYWGINYYTKKQTETILAQIRQDAPFESERLIPWLEQAKDRYNGFYLLGI